MYIQQLYMEELKTRLKTNAKIPASRVAVISIFHSSGWLKDALSSELRPFDLSLEQFNVLRILRGQNGNPINLQDIQERMVTKMSNTTRLVDKLIHKNFVKRQVCEKNRRKVEIEITSLGLATLKQLDPIIETTEKQITSSLSTDELFTLNKLLLKLKN